MRSPILPDWFGLCFLWFCPSLLCPWSVKLVKTVWLDAEPTQSLPVTAETEVQGEVGRERAGGSNRGKLMERERNTKGSGKDRREEQGWACPVCQALDPSQHAHA